MNNNFGQKNNDINFKKKIQQFKNNDNKFRQTRQTFSTIQL